MTVFLVFMSRQVNVYSLQGLQIRRVLRPQEKRGGGWQGGLGGGVLWGFLGFLFVLLTGLHERPISCSLLLLPASVWVHNRSVATAYTLLVILCIALRALHMERYVTHYPSNCAILIHTSARELLGSDLLDGVSSIPGSPCMVSTPKEF